MIKTLILSTLMLFAWTAAGADDAADAEAKIREYFDVFNAKDAQKIAQTVYSVPLHIANQTGHRAYITAADAVSSLQNLYEQIESQGWAKSVIQDVDVCIVTEGLAFAEVRYTRNKANGEAIAPGIRTNIYVVQELPPGWRIVAFYSKDVDRKLSCQT
jgi:hypothetical protein